MITLGKTQIRVYKLPGHTAGSPSFKFTVFDNGRPHTAFLFGGPGQRNGVEGGTQFLESIRRLKSKEFADVEVPVHVHSWLTTYPDPRGGTLHEVAALVHRDMAANFKYARVWGTAVLEPGTQMKGDYVVHDKDVVEIHE